MHLYPEIFVNIEKCFSSLSGIGQKWALGRKPYIVTFEVGFDEIEWLTFYDDIDDYKTDAQDKLELKKKLIQWSYYRMQDAPDNNCLERFFYLKKSYFIRPNSIISCEPVNFSS